MRDMRKREVVKALRQAGCVVVSDDGGHAKWACPCGRHSANIPRHTVVSVGVVRDTIRRMDCLPKGWLQ